MVMTILSIYISWIIFDTFEYFSIIKAIFQFNILLAIFLIIIQ